MATRFLPDTSRFKLLKPSKFMIFVFGLYLSTSVLNFWLTDKAYAAKWFATYGGGVLSGKSAGEGIVSNQIPSSGLPSQFSSDIIQRLGSGDRTTFGSLISSAGQKVNSDGNPTEDAFVKNTQTVLPAPAFFSSTDQLNGSGYTVAPTGTCNTLLNSGSLKTLSNSAGRMVYRVTVGCMESAINGTSGTYNLNENGLAVIFVYDDGTDQILDIDKKLVSADATSPDKERILIITEAKIQLGDGVRNITPLPAFDVAPDLQVAAVSTASSGESYYLSSASGNPIITEGLIFGVSNISIGTDPFNNFPGFFVKYNSSYVSELSKVGSNSQFNVKGLMQSKTTWRYD